MTNKPSNSRTQLSRYVAFLRGINVGGQNIIKMDELRAVFAAMGFRNVKSILASGNVLFDAPATDTSKLSRAIEKKLSQEAGREIAVLTRSLADLEALVASDPFAKVKVTPETRLYVTFLAAKSKDRLKVPYKSPNGNFTILSFTGTEACSMLTLAETSKSTDAMKVLEAEFGKQITTRNWKTIQKVVKG